MMNRKTLFGRIMMMVMALAVLSLTACEDDDVDQAYDMNGIWQGTIEGNYYQDRFGFADSWDTEIQFVQDGDFSRGGQGVERDYSYRTDRMYMSYFDWEVRNGKILMRYDDGFRVIIRDYEMYTSRTGTRFRGYFDDYDTGETMASFNLIKVSDWTDWAKKHGTGLSEQKSE